ncbi:calcium-binding protein [Streptomyces sp. NPDC002588]|uniref:calcium-binding protein n=1 Tax=Streptomyces sp. NPDC002588 TaxID=3154419 RepID=UPI0033184173
MGAARDHPPAAALRAPAPLSRSGRSRSPWCGGPGGCRTSRPWGRVRRSRPGCPDGDPVVVGTGARTVTVEVTATDPTGLEQIDARLYHGSYEAPDAAVTPAAACGATADTGTTCTLTFTLTPGTAPATDAQAGAWSVSAYAIGRDGDAEFLNSAAAFSVQRETQVSMAAAPKRVRRGRTVTVTGATTDSAWATGTSVPGAAGRPVELQFRPRGGSRFCTVKTVRTAADGTLSTTVRAYDDGSYRWSAAGTETTAAAVSPDAFVDVTG